MKWDYKIGDDIPYFDAEKSYELTGYRPINKTQGLDFNPDWFRGAAISKLTTGTYSGSVYGSRSYKEFWDAQKKRCNEGYSSNGYRITGDNYFFLNFYNLKTSESDTINQAYGFPMFLVFQYEYFHYVELCEKLGYDVALLKSRGIGFSEMASSFSTRPYTTIPNYRIMVTTFSKGHLDPTLEKMWYQLDWLNEHTEGAFRRVRMNINTKMHKRASVKNRDLSEEGHMSEIQGIIADEPDKLRGDRVQKLIFEEAGADPALGKKWVKGEALITVLGGKRVGMRIAFGTGGSSKASSMEGLKSMIESPEASNILPVRHNYTADRRYIITGLFIPAYRIVYQFIDKRGYCDEQRAIDWYEKERKKKGGDPKALLDYKAEYCFTIEEALIQKEGNVFPVEELANQLAALDVYKTVEKPKTGFLVWEINRDSQRTGKVLWRDDPKGNILIKEPPILGESGHGYKNLYVGGIDSIDIGEQDTATQDKSKLSDFCVVIKKRVLGLETPAYVAMYKDRPRDIREAYENTAKLLTWYEAQAVLESTRTAIITHFRNKKYLHLLMKRPRSTTANVLKTNTTMYGTPTPPRVITHYIELVYDFCLDYAQTMNFREMLDQLVNYSDEAKKKFDIIAAMGMAELADEELSTRKPVEREPVHKVFKDFGWWTDANGYKHYGVIPTNENERYEQQRIRKEDSWLYS